MPQSTKGGGGGGARERGGKKREKRQGSGRDRERGCRESKR